MARARSPMDFETFGIGTALKRNRLAVPLNQREYSWEERHVQDLFQDLANAIDNNKQSYFLGTIALTSRADGVLEISDGQQRLATTTILLASFRDYFHRKNDLDMVGDLEDFLFTFVRSTRERNPRLRLNVTDDDFFRRRILEWPYLTSSLDVNKQYRSRYLIDNAANMAAVHVDAILKPFSESNKNDHLNRWIDFIEHATTVILATVPDDLNAYVMFETLNDRGLRTTQADLVKNYLFSESGTRIDEAQQRWASMNGTLEAIEDDDITITFLRHLLISLHGHVKEREVLERVQGRVKGRAPAIEFLDTLSLAARDYVAMLTPTHQKWIEYPAVTKNHVGTLLLLEVTPLRPLMLAVSRTFSHPETGKAFRQFVSWSVRLLIAGGARSGRVEEALAEAARKVSVGEVVSAAELLEDLRPVLPNDTAFQLAFREATVANHALARYYLRALEQKSQGKSEPEWVPNEENVITLGHVLPQHPGCNWMNVEPAIHSVYYRRLGNMVLSSQTTNHGLGNDSFADKKAAYYNSTYELTKELGDLTNWQATEIEQRQSRLAGLAVETWPLG
jgi:hypothetical protein